MTEHFTAFSVGRYRAFNIQRHQSFRKYSTVQGITHQMSKLPSDQMWCRNKVTFQRNYKFLQRLPGSIKTGLVQLGSLQPATRWPRTRQGHFEGKSSMNARVNRNSSICSGYCDLSQGEQYICEEQKVKTPKNFFFCCKTKRANTCSFMHGNSWRRRIMMMVEVWVMKINGCLQVINLLQKQTNR